MEQFRKDARNIENNTYRLERSHRKQIGHDGGEAGRQARLRDEAQLQLAHTDDIVAAFQIPRRYVEKVGLVVILHQLDDDSNVIAIVFDRDHSHYVGRVLGVRVLAVFVGEH